jgi:CheY-like chemotaxis protein
MIFIPNKPDRDSDLTGETKLSSTNSINLMPMLAKILVVEDNLEAQTTLCELLPMLGYEAIGASSAKEALDLLADVDILLTDINLPGMSGIELAIQCHARFASKAIILSSGMDIPIRLPFEVFILPKPFSMMMLSETLDNAIKQKPKS